MWKNNSKNPSDAANVEMGDGDLVAFVGKSVTVKGSITYEGTVRIDGRVEGEIHTDGVVIVGEEAVISAKVTVGALLCKGKITGEIVAKHRVKLMAPAVLDGSVLAPVFSIEEGVVFNGTCRMAGVQALNVSHESASTHYAVSKIEHQDEKIG
jgi:cytoskeletal protein CcmA (bactofilin family)